MKRIWPGALVVCLAVLAYLPSLSGLFLWNDSDYVTAPVLRSPHGLLRIWAEPGETQQYYPLLHTAFWVEHGLFGDHPLGYHVLTVLLHAASAVGFALVLRRLLPGDEARAVAWLAALVFALHPVNVESVAWITEQKNTLSLALYLASALAYLRFDETRGPRAYAAALSLFVLSLLCKTVTATLPAALLVVFWWRRGRLSWRRDVLPLAPWLVLGASAGLFSSWVEKAYVGAQGADFNLSLAGRALVAGRAIWFYVGKLAWPAGLNFIYPRWTVDASDWRQWLFPLGAVAAVAALWALRRRSRAPLAACLIFVGSLFPALSFVNLYGARYSWVWDHWQYLPDLSLIGLGAAGLVGGWRLVPALRPAGPALAAALLLLLGALTWSHCAMFSDDETLWRSTLGRNPTCWMAYNNLAAKLVADGRVAEAMADLRASLEFGPGNAAAYATLGDALCKQGRLVESFAQYGRSLEIEPNNVQTLTNLGGALLRAGRIDEAVARYGRALALDPEMAGASAGLGDAYLLSGRTDEALAELRRALELDPGDVPARVNLGAALAQKGRVDEAIAEFREALRLDPTYAPARINLGNALLQAERAADAIAQFTQALAAAPSSSAAHNGLGLGLMMSGQRDQAIAQFQRALELDPDNAGARRNLADALRAR
jgi:tetratricopeptide (TPR) repeat protein